jgi:hypothetical protein
VALHEGDCAVCDHGEVVQGGSGGFIKVWALMQLQLQHLVCVPAPLQLCGVGQVSLASPQLLPLPLPLSRTARCCPLLPRCSHALSLAHKSFAYCARPFCSWALHDARTTQLDLDLHCNRTMSQRNTSGRGKV